MFVGIGPYFIGFFDCISKYYLNNKNTKFKKKAMNKIREIVIDKLILNISVETSGDKLTKASPSRFNNLLNFFTQ